MPFAERKAYRTEPFEMIAFKLHSAALLGGRKSVACFDVIASDYESLWEVLSEVRRHFVEPTQPAFCEWGSGLGIVTGMAEILEFPASRIKIDATLAHQSGGLLMSQGLQATIVTGS